MAPWRESGNPAGVASVLSSRWTGPFAAGTEISPVKPARPAVVLMVLLALAAVGCSRGTLRHDVATDVRMEAGPVPGLEAAPAPDAVVVAETPTSTTEAPTTQTSATQASPPQSSTVHPPAPRPSGPAPTVTTRPTETSTTVPAATPSTTTTRSAPQRPRSNRVLIVDTAKNPGAGYNYRLLIMDLDRWTQEEVARDVSFWPSWSPDGSSVAYTDFNGKIWVHTLATGERRQLTAPDVHEGMPIWSPDGSKLAYDGDGSTLNVMNADGTDRHTVGRTGPYAPEASWSPDGRRIVFPSDTGIWSVNADGSDLKRLQRNGLRPAYSPDGAHIAFHDNFALWVMDADGSNPHQLGAPAAVSELFSWSADSRHLAAVVSRPDTTDWTLHTWDIQTGVATPLGPPGDANTGGVPVFSPDGVSLIYSGQCGTTTKSNLCLINRISGAQQILDDYSSGGRPVFAPR
jgi:Tol biopolymer transport system component